MSEFSQKQSNTVSSFDVHSIKADFPILQQQVNGLRWCISIMRRPPKSRKWSSRPSAIITATTTPMSIAVPTP